MYAVDHYINMFVAPIDRQLYRTVAVRTPTVGDGPRTIDIADMFSAVISPFIAVMYVVLVPTCQASRGFSTLETLARPQKHSRPSPRMALESFVDLAHEQSGEALHACPVS